MASKLSKFSEKTMKFLRKAHQQKDAAWLEENQETYEFLVKKPFIHLAETLKKHLQSLARD